MILVFDILEKHQIALMGRKDNLITRCYLETKLYFGYKQMANYSPLNPPHPDPKYDWHNLAIFLLQAVRLSLFTELCMVGDINKENKYKHTI